MKLKNTMRRLSSKKFNPRKLVSWLSLVADVCCDLSNPSDAYLFSSSSSNFMNSLNDFKETKWLRAKNYTTQGTVYRDLGRYSEAKEYYEKALIKKKRFTVKSMVT